MKRRYTYLLIGIFLIATVSAIYGGESVIVDIGEDYEYYSVVGNSSEVVLDIQQNGSQLIITPSKYSSTDTYEIVFFNKETEIVSVPVSGGRGGGTRTIYKDRNVTQYKDKIVEKIVEKEIPTEVEKIVEKIKLNWQMSKPIVVALILIIVALLGYNIYHNRNWNKEEDEDIYRDEKEVKENE